MLSFRSQAGGSKPAIAEAKFREVMRRPAIAREFFLPIDHAWWDGGSYTLGRWAAKAPRPHNTGVRLQEPRSANPGLLPEKGEKRGHRLRQEVWERGMTCKDHAGNLSSGSCR